VHPIGVFAAHHFSLDVAVEVVLRPRGASIARVKAHKMEAHAHNEPWLRPRLPDP